MSHPFKYFCYVLAEKLGKDITEVMAMSSSQISEWMAFYMSQGEDWKVKYEKDKERQRQQNDPEYRAKLFRQMLGGNNGNNS